MNVIEVMVRTPGRANPDPGECCDVVREESADRFARGDLDG